MSDRRENALRVDVGALVEFADRIDVRSPAEFALDHVPRAENHPVLDDVERAEIGTLYAMSPFDARRLGAAKVSRNIARLQAQGFIEVTGHQLTVLDIEGLEADLNSVV